MLTFIGYILGLMGVALFFISGIGLLRMPDTLTRMQAATKASTLGSLLVILAVACFQPEWAFKLIILAVFILITNPISSSILAMATYKRYYKKVYNTSGTDALKEEDK